jgi:hypothetical protein
MQSEIISDSEMIEQVIYYENYMQQNPSIIDREQIDINKRIYIKSDERELGILEK